MADDQLLRDASVQDIQLELIRRTRFNAMDGPRVYESLIRHRELWLSALLDRQGVARYDKPQSLLIAGLIKLRDLSGNYWNADTLFVLTEGAEKAHRLSRAIEEEDWGEVLVYTDQEEVGAALGTGRREYGVVTVWWD